MKPWNSPKGTLVQTYIPPSSGNRLDKSKTAIACGTKNRASATSQRNVTPIPLFATPGTKFRFTIATTNSKVRSTEPSTFLSLAVLLLIIGDGCVIQQDCQTDIKIETVTGREGFSKFPRSIRWKKCTGLRDVT